MIAVTGITGNIGSVVGRHLLARTRRVRAVLRDARKAQSWADSGCEIAIADIGDTSTMTAAFAGADAVFILVPPVFDPSPGFPEALATAATLKSAIESAGPGRVVYLSTIGAQAAQTNLLTQHSLIENTLRELSLPIAFLRPGWFMENCSWDVGPARERGVIPSFLQPLDRPVPMVAIEDIGKVAAELLQETWNDHRVVELEGPKRVAPSEIAATFSDLIGRPVSMEIVPRETWDSLFRSQGMKNPEPRIQMLDGFNKGWIDFEGGQTGSRKGSVGLKTVLKALIDRQETG